MKTFLKNIKKAVDSSIDYGVNETIVEINGKRLCFPANAIVKIFNGSLFVNGTEIDYETAVNVKKECVVNINIIGNVNYISNVSTLNIKNSSVYGNIECDDIVCEKTNIGGDIIAYENVTIRASHVKGNIESKKGNVSLK